jgi:glycosyltransferase involved in cell wall biosynthesis
MSAGKESATTGASQEHRWLFIDGASAFGGHEVMLLQWLEELAAQHTAECFLLARDGSQLACEATRHASLVSLAKQGGGRLARWLGAVRDIAATVRAIISIKPQLCVIAEGCLLAQPLFATTARLLGCRVVIYVPLVQTSVSMGFGSGRLRDALVRRWYAHVPHAWITITEEQARGFRAWARVRRPIFVLPNTVSTALESRGARHAPERSTSSGEARLEVLVLGRIEAHQKGLDLLLAFAAAHPELGARMNVTLIGSGPYEAAVRARLSQDAALARWVAIRPWSPTADALADHDVLLMTSRYEGVPLVMLEAMALGVPVVAPDLDGTRPFLHHSDLFPRMDIEGAFARLQRMTDPATRRAAVERNRARFESSASNAAFAAAVKALSQKLVLLASGSLRRRSA